MTFAEQYLTYTEYKRLGGKLEETPFNLLEFEARRKIDIKTFDRLKHLSEIPQEVKLCEFALIESISSYNEALNGVSANVASETIDGYSATYVTSVDADKVIKAKEQETNAIIRNYLLNVIIDGQHIMYCGADK